MDNDKTFVGNQSVDSMAQFFAYAHLPEHLQAVSKPFGELADDARIKTLGVIHVTKELKTPKLVIYDSLRCFSDWTVIRRAWCVAKRLGGKER